MNRLRWVWRADGIDWPRVLLLALAGALLVSVVFFASTSSAAFDPFHSGWDGTSEFRQQVSDEQDVSITYPTDTTHYEEVEPEGTVAFVIAPDESYDGGDADRVRQFVESGGTLVVLENFGQAGNALLGDVGATASVDGRLVRDEQHHDRAPTMPVATEVENHTSTRGVDQLTLNYGSVVEPGNATVLVRTSEFAYLVESEETGLDDDTELAASPVATAEPVGAGTVVVVSDPSLVTNIMMERPDNAAFVEGLYVGAEQVLIDRSHATSLPPLTQAVLAFRGSALLQALVGIVGVVAVALFADSRFRPSRYLSRALDAVRGEQLASEQPLSSLSDAERTAYLQQRYPDWEEKRIQRVITAFKEGAAKREGERET